MTGKITLVLIFILCICGAKAQVADTVQQQVDIYYSSPKTYELAGVKVVGGDYDGLASIAGLTIGMPIQIPGETITRAIKRLYDQGLFSNISIAVDRIEDDKVYLTMYIQERHKLSKINYIGLKKSEENKIKEKMNLGVGSQVTDFMKTTLKSQVEKYLKEKGYYNTNIKIIQRDDPKEKNYVVLDVIVEKHNKIKIADIIINGNEQMKDGRLKAAMKKTKEKSLVNFFKSSNYIEKNYDEDKYHLVDKYNEKGFRDAVIVSDSVVQISPKRVKIYIDVQEGNKYYFNNISWVGNTIYDSETLSRILNIKKGDVYNSKYLNERITTDEDAVSNIYQNNGYLFSRLMPIETIAGEDSIQGDYSR